MYVITGLFPSSQLVPQSQKPAIMEVLGQVHIADDEEDLRDKEQQVTPLWVWPNTLGHVFVGMAKAPIIWKLHSFWAW